MKRTLGLVVAAGLVLVGCGSSSKSPTGASATTIAAKTATTAPGGATTGAAGALTVTLPAGKYVLICNLGTGVNNHAAKGMHIDITVS